MNGTDWVAVAVLTALLVATLYLDSTRRRDDERAEQLAQRAAHRRLLNEMQRH